MPFLRSDQALINVSVTGVTLDNLPWSQLEGFDNTPESTQTYPGGMAPLVELGGFAKPTVGTLSRPWQESLIKTYKELWSKAGQAEVTVTWRALNANKEPIGEPITYTGILGTVTRPNYKAGTSEEAKLQITVMPHGELA